MAKEMNNGKAFCIECLKYHKRRSWRGRRHKRWLLDYAPISAYKYNGGRAIKVI